MLLSKRFAGAGEEDVLCVLIRQKKKKNARGNIDVSLQMGLAGKPGSHSRSSCARGQEPDAVGGAQEVPRTPGRQPQYTESQRGKPSLAETKGCF